MTKAKNIQISLADSSVSMYLDSVSGTIDQLVSDSDKRISGFLDYLKDSHGKMLRPAMMLFCAQAVSDIEPKPEHIKAAAVAEMIHSATLMHDDVIDSADSRRHKPTANKIWDSRIAILLGDFLLSRAFASLSQIQRNDVTEIFAHTTDTICRGEMLQNSFRSNFNITENDYIEIIKKKTAVFFSSCCRIGALLSETDEKLINELAAFGLNFGIAFQIADDLTDVIGDEISAGKTLLRDIATNNFTLPIIHAIGKLDSGNKRQFIDNLKEGRMKVETLKLVLDSTKSTEYTISRIRHYVETAITHIDNIKNASAHKNLLNLAQSLISTTNA